MKKILVLAALASISLSGCAAVQTEISHKDLQVSSKMTDTVFLDPVGAEDRTVFVQTRNTSDKPDFTIEAQLKAILASKGYQISYNPNAAHYLLQVNILQVGLSNPSAAEASFAGGFGSALGAGAAGAAVGGLIAGPSHNTGTGMAVGGLAAAGVSLLADSLVHNTTYSVITDVQISEHSKVPVRQAIKSHLKNGRSTVREQNSYQIVDKNTYRTRVMSTANQVNLEYQDAVVPLENGVATSIAGMF